MKYFTLILITLFLFARKSFSQAVTAGDCNIAINICSNAGFQIDPNGTGSVYELSSGGSGGPGGSAISNPSTNPASANMGCLLSGELNSTWMIVNIQTSGSLQFSFGGGGAQAGYYDWAMWSYAGPATCNQITNVGQAPIRCNWNGVSSGGTGLANPLPAGGTASNYEPPLAVTCGQKFIICFSNYSSASSSVPLAFFGTAGVSCAPIPNPITVNSATICGSQVAALTATGAAGNTYTWTPGGSTGSTLNVSPAVTTTYTVSASGGCGSQVGTQTTVVNVTTGPTSSITSVVNNTPGGGADPTPAVQCLTPNSFNFNAPAAAGTHSWNFGGGGASPATSAAVSPTGITYSTPGTYTVTHTVSNGGCVSTSSTVVTISAPPTSILSSVPSCANTGSASVTASGGIPGYTYNWLPSGGTGTTATGLALGTYSVTVTDANGCIVTNTVTVSTNPKPSATLSFTNPNCGAANGIIVINNTSPVTPPQTVSFASNMGSVSGQTVTGLGAGTPVITLTNNFGCTFTVSTTLINSAGPTALPLTPNNIICGIGTGSITIGAPTGGTSPYTYNVNGGAFSTTPPVTGLASGTYTVGVRDANGCIFTNTVTISVTTGPTAIAGTTTPAGCGLTNGTYNITGVTGGTAPYTYTVNGVTSGSLTTNLAAGTYPVIVRDVNGCLFNTTFVVGGTTGPTSATIATTNANCGSANGSATVTGVTGGAGSNQYSYDGGAFTITSNTTALTAGTHTVIVKDANTCTVSVTYNILNTGSPTASVTNTVNVSCFGGSNGSFTVTPAGGTGPLYTYTLTSPFQTNGTGFFSGLPQGSYNITVMDQVGCVTTTSVTIIQPTVVTLTPTAVAAQCFGAATGTINVVGAGGTPTYSYNLNAGADQSSPTFVNQFAGIYSIGIKDANGCTATQTIQITQPTALGISVSAQNANCTAANGVASATVTGGTGVITYSWTGGGGAAAISNSVVAGNYTVTATDANGCSISSSVAIGLTLGGTASVVSTSSITCNGLCNGNITVGMTGGAAPFTYSWSPSGGTGPGASNLCPGTYSCEITDFYGCKSTTSGTIIQPPLLNAIMNSNNVKCFGTSSGTVSAAGTGGTFPYTYLWTSPITNTAATVPNVSIGTYVCNITDANNCSITQTIAVTQPSSLTITSTVTAANCNLANGSATITISGGSGPYNPIWSDGTPGNIISSVSAGTYTINVQDANNCSQTLAATIPNLSGPTLTISTFTNISCFGGNNGGATASASGGTGTYSYSWNTGPGTPVATNLIAGVYTASVTDQAGCVASASVTISQPSALLANIVPIQPKCFGALNGGGVASVIGGTVPYTYTWTSTGGNNLNSNPLGAGNYGLTVTDDNGCVATASMTLVNPPAMAASITATNVTCFGLCDATAIATSTNGIGVISYFWTGAPSAVTSQTLTGACAGSYTVLATDQNSCTATAQINITQPTQITANISSTGSVTCNGGNDGFSAVSASGGTGALSYNWSPSGITAATANTLTAGVYVVTVTDDNLCATTATATILQPSPLSTTLTTTNVKCNGGADGTANIAYLGGAGTTTFLWGPGLQSGNPVNNLLVGPQTVTITSNAACPTVLTFTLTEPAALTAAVSATNSNCGLANGKVCAVVSGGTGFLTTLWSNGISTLCNNNVLAGAYTFSVSDANGCVAQASGLINDIAGPVVSITSQTNISCFGGSNGAATTNIVGGSGAVSVFWSPSGQTTQNVNNFNVGIKNITVTDAAGCVGTASVQIIEPAQLVSAIGSSTNVSCFGLSNGGATVLVNGGTPGYTYSWSPSAQTNSVLVNVPVSSPTVTVTDANGCTSTSSLTISQPQAVVMAASSFTNVSCFGGSNGQISTTVQGGMGGFTYVWLPAGSAPSLSGLVAGGYSVTVTDANSCSINANFNINEPSALTSTYTSLPATCGLSNGSATVTIGGGTPTYSLVWNITGTPTGSVATNIAPGNWSVLGTDSKGCTITQTINVANPPVSTITGFNVIPPSCFGLSNGEIAINYTAGSGPYTVSWSSPISQVNTSSALTQSIVGVTSGVYTATLTDVNGCTTSQPVSVTQPYLLVLIPTPNPSITICYGQSTQISASGQNGTPAYTYSWPSNPFIGAGPHTVNPTTTTQYTVSVTDSKGCSPPPKIITVNVTPPLVVTPTVITMCDGEQTTLTPNFVSVGNGGPYTYNWTPGASSASSLTVIGNAPGVATTYTYAVTVDDGCTIPTGVAVFTVNVNPLPVIDFVATPTAGCAPLTLTLTGTSNNVGDLFTWQDIGNGVQGNNAVITIATPGLYTASLFVTNPATGCQNDIRKTNYIEVFAQPVASFYAAPQSVSILDPNINFINTSQGASSYFWNFGDLLAIGSTNTSTLTNPNHFYSVVGSYAVNLVATSINGCTDTARVIVEITPDFALYIPNTFTPDGNGMNDVFQPLGVGIDEENYRMDIYDRWGENIFTSNAFRKGWDGTVKGGSKIAEQGVYIYKLMVMDTQGNKHPYVGHVTVIKKEN